MEGIKLDTRSYGTNIEVTKIYKTYMEVKLQVL